MNPTSSNTLLTYSLDTLPDPLQASPVEGNTVYGALSFVISNGGNTTVELSQLQFTLPVGTLAQDLTSNSEAILWGTSPGSLWDVTMTSPGVFLFVPKSGSPIPVSTGGMVIQLYNIPVNQQVGTVCATVTETATDSNSPAKERAATFDVAKFPYGFYFANFTAQVPMVQDGGTVTLTWQGSDNATYSMYWSDDPPVDVTDVRSWVSPALTGDTTFLLRASVVSQGETVTTDLSTTVIVANPELQASSLVVSGTTNLQGTTTIGASDSQTTVNSDLTVAGATLLSGTATLRGNTVAENMAVNGNLSSGTSATFNNVGINGTLAAIKGAQAFGEGTYAAKTDGIVVAYISSGGAPPGNVCQGYIIAGMPYGTFWLNGGNYSSPGLYANGGSVMSLPLAQGQSCSVRIDYSSRNQNNPPCSLYFLPLGGIPKDKDILVKISDDVPEVESPPEAETTTTNVESIAEAMLKSMESGDVGRLADALQRLCMIRNI